MFHKIAEIFEVSFDELHNPQKTLALLSGETLPEISDSSSENAKSQKKLFTPLIISALGIIFILIAILLLVAHFSKQNATSEFGQITAIFNFEQIAIPEFEQIALRNITDETYGEISEMAILYHGEALSVEAWDEETGIIYEKWIQGNINCNGDVLKISCYTNFTQAEAWEPTFPYAYLFKIPE